MEPEKKCLSTEEQLKIDKVFEAYDYLLPKVIRMIQKNRDGLIKINTCDGGINLVDKTTEIMDSILCNTLDMDDIDDDDIDRLLKGG
jgi:inactivated superfamily I helicase